LFGYAGDFADQLRDYPQIVDSIRRAALRMDISNVEPFYFFKSLSDNQIDIRAQIGDQIIEHWGSAERYKESVTFHFYLYIAGLADNR
jgi:hypothetical protein